MLSLAQKQCLFLFDTFVVLDIETTGLSPQKGGRIIEIGAVKVENGCITSEFSAFINPDMNITPKITELTGITNDMVADAPSFHSVLSDFIAFIGDAVVVAHNAPFDWDRFLVPYFQKVGHFATNLVLDTRDLFKSLYPGLKKQNLALMCETLSVENENHHRANNDARATAICFLMMRETIKASLPNDWAGDVKPLEMPEEIAVYPKKSTRISGVNPWSKQMTKKKTLERLYIRLYDRGVSGTVFFDQQAKVWENKDFPANVNFSLMEQEVLSHLNLETADELCTFKK